MTRKVICARHEQAYDEGGQCPWCEPVCKTMDWHEIMPPGRMSPSDRIERVRFWLSLGVLTSDEARELLDWAPLK